MVRRKRKRANGMGSITLLKGNSTKSYWVRAGKERKSLGTFKTYKEAVAVLDEYNYNPYDIDGSSMNFKELCEIFLKSKKNIVSEETYRGYNFKMQHCKELNYIFIKDIKVPHLQNLMNKINLSSGSKREIKSFLVMLFEYAVQMEYIPINRAKSIKLGKHKAIKPKSIFTADEIKRLWENKDIYIAKVVLFMIYTGLRIGEVSELKKENIDFINHIIENAGNKTEKSKKRIIPIHNDIFEITKEIFEYSKNNYFVYIKHERITEKSKETATHKQTIRRYFLELMKSLGMSHIPHDTRGTFASLLDRNNISETIITDVMGHTDIKTTQEYYIQNDIETIKENINKIKILN